MSERGAAQKFFYTLHCLRVCPWKQDRRLQKPVGVTQASVASWQAGSESHCSTHLDLYVVGSTLDSICIVQVISLLTQIFQQWFTRRKRITRLLTRLITRFFTYGWFILRLSFHMSHSNIENNIRVGKVQNSFLFPLKLSCCRKWVCWREVGLEVHYHDRTAKQHVIQRADNSQCTMPIEYCLNNPATSR